MKYNESEVFDMIIGGRNVKLGISFGKYQPEDTKKFIDAGFECFELVIPARMPDPNPYAKSPQERRINPYTLEESRLLACRGEEEKLVGRVAHLADAILKEGDYLWSVHLPFGGGWDAAHFCEEDRTDAVRGLKRIIDLTACWHPSVYVLHGCLEPVSDEQREARMNQSIKSVRELGEYAARYGAKLALEDLPRSCLGNCTAEMERMISGSGVSICFDVNHLLEDTHENFMNSLTDKIITTHLSDYDGIDERHWLPGEGVVPWKMIFERLENADYTGPYLFELRTEDDTPYTPERIISAFRKAIEG